MLSALIRRNMIALCGASILELAATASQACDLCGCYTPQSEAMPQMQPLTSTSWATGWFAAAAEQFTYFGTLQIDGREVANPTGQYENSSITQLVAGYNMNDRFALQLNLPLIDREFKTPKAFAISFLIIAIAD